MLISWPRRWRGGQLWADPVTLTDLFGLATEAACGRAQLRDGFDLARSFDTRVSQRRNCIGLVGAPGTRHFKAMVREGEWKYIWLANGGQELLFDVAHDPHESSCHAGNQAALVTRLRTALITRLTEHADTRAALNGDQDLLALPFEEFRRERIKQFAPGVQDFGEGPLPSRSFQ